MILDGNVAVGVIDGDEDAVSEGRDLELDAGERALIETDVEFEYTAGIRCSRPEQSQQAYSKARICPMARTQSMTQPCNNY